MERNILVLHPDYPVHKRYANLKGVGLLFDPQEFNAMASEIKDDFSTYIDTISKGKASSVDWWVTALAGRDPFGTFVFQEACYALYAEKIMRNGVVSEIVCCSRELKRVIEKFPSAGAKIKISARSRVETRLGGKEFLHSLARSPSGLLAGAIALGQTARFLAAAVRKHLAARASRREGQPVLDSGSLRLLDVFVFRDSFPGGTFETRHYRSLTQLIPANWAYLPNFIDVDNFRNAFRYMRRNRPPFIVKQDFLRFADYAWAIGHLVRIHSLKRLPLFKSVDLSPILQRYYIHDGLAAKYEALLNYRLAKRLRERSVGIELILDWFENQKVDKAQNLGFKRWYPGVPIVGYTVPYVSEYAMYLQPTRVERSSGVIPGIIGVTGRGAEEFVKHYDKALPTILVPAFGYTHVWEKRNHTSEGSSIVVALPLTTNKTLEVLHLINEALTRAPGGLTWHIKPHPLSNRAAVKNFLKNEGVAGPFMVVEESIDQLLDRAAILISSGSSVVLEAMARGIPVIIVGSQAELTHDPAVGVAPGTLLHICYSARQLVNLVEQLSHPGEEGHEEMSGIGHGIREECFEPVNESTLSAFRDTLASLAHRTL
jgi:hypothetical protein